MEKRKRVNLIRWGLAAFAAALAVSALVATLRAPTTVEAGAADRGPVALEIVDEGRTRVDDVFAVAAPVSGRLQRVTLEPGDPVSAGQVVAVIAPAAPELLDARTAREAQARIAAARAGVADAEAQARLAADELRRTQALAERNVAAPAALERAQTANEAAQAALRVRRADLASAEALLRPGSSGAGRTQVRAPIGGVVLQRMQESETVIPAGATLLTIGDLADLEVVGEFLSQDAVRIPPGAAATIENWGGPPIAARVERVEPFARLKVSALGVEEQRTDVVLAIEDRAAAARLGHDYRVDVRVRIAEEANALRVPTDALVRDASGWSVFRIVDGRARRTVVEVGEASGPHRPVLKGLSEGDVIVRYPPNGLKDGVRVRPG